MGRFKFCLIGTTQAPVLELPAGCVGDLHGMIERARYVEGWMVEIDGEPTDVGVLIPTARIQFIVEAE